MASGTGNLPTPGMSFSPFAILTAEEQNQLVANIESLATGAGIGDAAITPSKISFAALSTTEKLVGTTDTGASIYERVFNGTITVGASTRNVTAITVTGVNDLIGWSGSFTAGTRKYALGSTWGTVTNTDLTVTSAVYLDGSTLNLITLVDQNRTAAPYKIILRYTKV